ncbi:MAG TPA: class I adenylate-forming enzyme family protein, partial [Armatimonadaceae bacterium]|nr:class I adenylate-forming enzyme family protein [Armatimonadaceae bacterium]
WANVGALLAERARATPDKNYLTFYEEDGTPVPQASLTYAVLYENARRVAALLMNTLGLAPGDRIATLTGNDPRTVLLYFGAWCAGVTVVPINVGEDDERIAFVLENARVKAAFAPSAQAKRASGCCPVVNVDETDLLAAEPRGALPHLPVDTEALIVYTSGTTGAPKGVVLEQYNLLVDAHGIAAWHGFGPDDRAMLVLPIHHVNGTVVTLVTPLYSGGSVVLNRKFSARHYWQTLAREGCTWSSVVPTVLAILCEQGAGATEGLDLSRFRHFVCGAGPLTTDLAARFEETFQRRVVHGYGLSETTCYSCFLPTDLDADAYRHWMVECGFPSIGIPIPENEMAIHDEQGNALPPDAKGEIVIRGHTVMRAYYRRPDANETTFAHGWFRSGDEGFYRVGPDDRPYFFITGRLKELIIRGGVNYSPFEIDEVLNQMPGVRAAMAVGFEHNFYGEEIGAYVQREPGSAVTEEGVLAFCAERLPFAKCPKVVLFGAEFPVTSTGKYQRGRLRERFAAWKDADFRRAK